ncbi:peptidase C15, pyroglutamyl peptidase I-like protein [Ascodesmis nigricans]|uniref:Peptidase C15, pyroglutamyl peptidase I-like protein n=1 Tax=Ascodesmis nigricans TaxID=341454 RepID=A0A4S2N027_9PEZI|nr:peptidase C15, pyroglutamyl peptidase I-like protein [Ascodesmis nigricans]
MPPPPPSSKTKTLHINITSFLPFPPHPTNPSTLIASLLPHTHIFTPPATDTTYTLHLHVHPPLKVAYRVVDEAVPLLWEGGEGGRDGGNGGREREYWLHLGVGRAGGYRLERRARCGGRGWRGWRRDVEGCLPGEYGDGGGDEMTGHGERERGEVEGDTEDKKEEEEVELRTGLDVPRIVDWVKTRMQEEEDVEELRICVSEDAGRFLCEYIFRASLMEARKRGEEEMKRVLFLHVPPAGKPYSVEMGAEVVKRIVEGMVSDGEGLGGA